MKQVCLNCWKLFESNTKWRKYCSLSCAYQHRTIHKEKKCIVCGEMFKPQNANQKYCCTECYNSVHRSTRLGEIQCLNCWKTFHPKDKSKKFCSLTCAYAYRTISTEKNCEWCWKIFMQNNPNQKFCSQKCAWKSHIKNWIITCPICWKQFKARNAWSIYCSRECTCKSLSIRFKGNRFSFTAKSSKIWEWYKDLLSAKWYDIEDEFYYWGYFYDIKIWNILIEINPYPYHNSTWSPVWKPKDEAYHFNKRKVATDGWFKCIMVRDWTTDDELFYMIEHDFVYEWGLNIHWYNPKDKDHIINNNLDEEDMVQLWYVKIIDWWNILYTS